jgi:hypothetical protein
MPAVFQQLYQPLKNTLRFCADALGLAGAARRYRPAFHSFVLRLCALQPMQVARLFVVAPLHD